MNASQLFRQQKAKANREKWERPFELQIRAFGLPAPEREYRFHPDRLWRFDFAWPALMLAFEIEGAPGHGRHTRPLGFAKDCEKYNEASLMGWTVYRVTGHQVQNGYAVDLLIRALGR